MLLIFLEYERLFDAGWSSPVARQAHNLKVAGSNPAPATNKKPLPVNSGRGYLLIGDASDFYLPVQTQ